MKKKEFFFVVFQGTFGLFGGGGEHVPLRPPPLGPELCIRDAGMLLGYAKLRNYVYAGKIYVECYF